MVEVISWPEPRADQFRRLVDEHLDEHELRSFTQAQAALEKERRGEGCGCNSCKQLVVREMNRWVDWLAKDNAQNLVHYRVNRRGKIVEYIPSRET